MRKIKLDFIGFWPGFNKCSNLFTTILREKYEIEISDNPDFLFVSPLGDPFEYLKYDCIRILFTGEPLSPDFNVFDYAIGFDYITFPDADGNNRFFRYPLCFSRYTQLREHIQGLSYEKAKDVLSRKKYFCNFIYGHRSAKGEREHLFDVISSYRRVESAGSFMNNMPDGRIVPFSDQKMDFLRLCKFTISCESISSPGFISEKIVHPFYSDSIPIYYGNPHATQEFNSQAIINCHDHPNFESVLERVAEIDQNDELYIKMLMEPKLISWDYLDKMYTGLQEFLWRIFSQDRDTAYRRLRHYAPAEHEFHLNEYRKLHKSFLYRVYRKIRRKRTT